MFIGKHSKDTYYKKIKRSSHITYFRLQKANTFHYLPTMVNCKTVEPESLANLT